MVRLFLFLFSTLGISTALISPKVFRTKISFSAVTEPASKVDVASPTPTTSKIISIGLDDEEFDEEDLFFGTGKVIEMMDDDKSTMNLKPSIAEWNPFKLFHWQNEEFDAGIFGENVLNTLEDVVMDVKRGLSPFYKSNAFLERSILTAKTRRPRVVVVGSGWASHAFLKRCETDAYEVICISPRPYFLFTPMLAFATVGGVTTGSIVEPIRAANPGANYVEGEMTDINVIDKNIRVNSKLYPDEDITIPYDYLIYAAGARIADYGVKGVTEHCSVLKEVDDVRDIKNKILNLFEEAALLVSLPETSEALLQQLLSFVVVGGGPTGVEFTGGLSDFIQEELLVLYPNLQPYVRVVLIEGTPTILSMFDQFLQAAAIDTLRDRKVDLRLKAKVTRIEKNKVFYKPALPPPPKLAPGEVPIVPLSPPTPVEEFEVPFGLCVWAAGTAARPITRVIAAQAGAVQSQSVNVTGRLLVDQWLRVQGLPSELFGSVLAMGDASVIGVSSRNQGPLPQTAQVASQQGTFLARLFNRRYRFSSLPAPSIPRTVADLTSFYNQSYHSDESTDTAAADRKLFFFERDATGAIVPLQSSPTASSDGRMKRTAWDWRVYTIQSQLRALTRTEARPFEFLNMGLLSYVGGSKAIAQVRMGDYDLVKESGKRAFLLWRSVYLVKQVSVRTRLLVLFDYLKSEWFGKDTTAL